MRDSKARGEEGGGAGRREGAERRMGRDWGRRERGGEQGGGGGVLDRVIQGRQEGEAEKRQLFF